ncbi:MAG: cytochrome-c peroxidase, partial [Chitinophagales bacterium]
MNDFADFTEEELAGKTVFNQHCATCHNTPTSEFGFEGPSIIDPFLSFQPHNTGLDELTTDLGVANHSGWEGDEGKFKTVNLKNVALTGPYMHDGRFETLEDVVDFYSDEIQNHPNSTFTTQPQYIDVDIFPQPFAGFGFTDQEKSDLVTFLHTLTDEVLINSPMWSDPF